MSIFEIGDCIYYGKRDGKYYLEAICGKPFDGETYKYVDEAYLIRKACKISNKTAVKWERPQSQISLIGNNV